jgi:hypothetical protein
MQIAHHFTGIYGMSLKFTKTTQKHEHLTSWKWEHSDVNQVLDGHLFR